MTYSLPPRFSQDERWDYRNAELRALCREHGIPAPSRLTHAELVARLRTAGVDLPPKQPQPWKLGERH